MKKILYFAWVIIAIIMASCIKNDMGTKGVNPKLGPRSDNISEVYVYEDQIYTLEFDPEDETGTPLNSEVEDDLIEAIDNNAYAVGHVYESGDTVFLFNVGDTIEEADTLLMSETPYPPAFATYYEHINFGGSSLSLTPNYPSVRLHTDGNTCNNEFILPYLYNLAKSSGGNWDDKISSFKMHQSGAAKTYYDANGWSGNGARIQFAMFRNQDLIQIPGGCYMEIWTMKAAYGTQDADWEVPNLTKQRWGYLCARMNDNVSAVTARVCKKNNSCSGSCVFYHDLIE